MADQAFDLWLEFEHWEAKAGDDLEDDCFNMQVTLAGGANLNLGRQTHVDRCRPSPPSE